MGNNKLKNTELVKKWIKQVGRIDAKNRREENNLVFTTRMLHIKTHLTTSTQLDDFCCVEVTLCLPISPFNWPGHDRGLLCCKVF